ncbi:hypothetical protein EJB05_45316, partial [Eragrostis curvula]
MGRWSSPKDPALEAALRRNRRWVVNNQIKRILLRFPSRTAPVRFLQSRFKTLDLMGRAANWLRKYPSCFEVFSADAEAGSGEQEPHFGFTKRMAALVDAEEAAVAASEPGMADRLARVLMLARGRRLQVSKLNALRSPLGLPDDYLLRLLPAHTDLFRLTNPYPHRRNASELELIRWAPSLAVSAVEAAAAATDSAPRFTCSLPASWAMSHAKMRSSIPRLTSRPTLSCGRYRARTPRPRSEPWPWCTKREFGLPEDTARMLHRHPCLFYISNRYKIHTVVLREGYEGSELKVKDPVVIAKDMLGELMQEGLHEYNRRRQAANLEKKRRRGEIEVKKEEEEREDEKMARLVSAEKREERRRFYRVLFGDGNRARICPLWSAVLNKIFNDVAIPLAMLNPRFSSSLYSWHSAQVSQQKWTQQSRQGDSCKLYCARIEERLLQVYSHWQPTDNNNTYRVPFMQQAGNKRSQSRRLVVFLLCMHLRKLKRRTHTCRPFVHNLSNAAKCNTGAPASQAACNIGMDAICIVLKYMGKKREQRSYTYSSIQKVCKLLSSPVQYISIFPVCPCPLLTPRSKLLSTDVRRRLQPRPDEGSGALPGATAREEAEGTAPHHDPDPGDVSLMFSGEVTVKPWMPRPPAWSSSIRSPSSKLPGSPTNPSSPPASLLIRSSCGRIDVTWPPPAVALHDDAGPIAVLQLDHRQACCSAATLGLLLQLLAQVMNQQNIGGKHIAKQTAKEKVESDNMSNT